ncbi:MAG TPA: hypothetical protein VI457_12015 [Methylococcaceae bacterium]|nr:hypothetical protein [Methylococcaceae bacterium]
MCRLTMRPKTLSAVIGALLLPIGAVATAATGPSSSAPPYLTPIADGVEFASILTVGDAVKKKHQGNETYRMVGIPDGLGAYDNGDGTLTVLMNHELGNSAGIARTHGGKGAFVSKWQIRKSDLAVLNGEDLIETVKLWNGTEYVDTADVAFNRFCAAELAAPTAFFNSHTGKGFNEGRIYMNGEEVDAVGRAFAHMAAGRQHGTTYELPMLGKAAWENVVASPYEQDKTVVAGLDDGALGNSKLFFYVGEKQEEGSPVELAGLTNGLTLQVAIDGYGVEPPVGFTSARFSLGSSGTGLNRVEDGNWDTQNPNRFYFVTTASFANADQGKQNSRLWRVTFDDIRNPSLGGTIEVLVDGDLVAPKVKMMDNMTVDAAGNVWIQEDVGNQAHLGKIWKFEPATGALTLAAQHDASRFLVGGANYLNTQDEESSGIVEVSEMFKDVEGYDVVNNRYFLVDAQAHYGIPGELVQGGQLLMMKTAR